MLCMERMKQTSVALVGALFLFLAACSGKTEVAGSPPVPVPHTSGGAPGLDALLVAAQEREARGGALCNPNNPTGTYVCDDDVIAFLDAVPEHVLVINDEAYFEYADSADYPDSWDYVRQGRSVIVLRTPGHTPGHQALLVKLPHLDRWIAERQRIAEPRTGRERRQQVPAVRLEHNRAVRAGGTQQVDGHTGVEDAGEGGSQEPQAAQLEWLWSEQAMNGIAGHGQGGGK